jgi:hypothetical protein
MQLVGPLRPYGATEGLSNQIKKISFEIDKCSLFMQYHHEDIII